MTSDLIATQRYVEDFPIDELREHPENPRLHDQESIDESIEENQFVGAIYVQESTKYMLSGHGRVKSLKSKGVTTVPVILIDCDDKKAEDLLIALNSVGQKSTYDKQLLAALLAPRAEMGDLRGTGYTPDDVDDLLAEGDDFVIPEVEFQGGYAEPPDAAQERAKRVAQTKESAGLRELVLVYDGDTFKRIEAALHAIGNFHATDSNSETVKAALINYAKGLEGADS